MESEKERYEWWKKWLKLKKPYWLHKTEKWLQSW